MSEAAAKPELVLSHLDSLPTLPAVAAQLLQVTGDPSSAAGDVVRILRADQSLCAKVLSFAGSAATAGRGGTQTIDKAVTLLGFRAVRSLALGVAAFDCLGSVQGKGGTTTTPSGFDRKEFWKHSLAVASAARRIAGAYRALGVDNEEAFVAGLLHDIGKVAMDALLPKSYARVAARANANRSDIADAERAIVGVDHTVAGRRIAERWRLPRELQEVVWLHHLSPDSLPASVAKPKLVWLVQLADTLVREQRLGYSGNHVFYEHSAQMATRHGIGEQTLAEVGTHLVQDVVEFATVLGLDREAPEAVYSQAMAQANSELSRLNVELLAGNRRLAAGARYFNAIVGFEQKLDTALEPAAVVMAMAGAAVTALQRPRCAAFGVLGEGEVLELVTQTGEGTAHRLTQRATTELTAWIREQKDALGVQITPAPPAVRGLIEPHLPHLGKETPWLMPLTHRGEVLGGLVFCSDLDERARLTAESAELQSFLASLSLAMGRARAQAAVHRLAEELADSNKRIQKMQSEVLRSRTLNMIADMAAGAGHELNSPLAVISGRAQMLSQSLTDPEINRQLALVAQKAHECSEIVSELMDFARPNPPDLTAVNAAELLEIAAAEAIREHNLSADRVRVETSARSLAPVLADREQLRGVLLELLRNAVDAVSENQGHITLSIVPGPTEETIEIVVRDTGCGMAASTLERIFDPFFSHRRAGRGRGLGLPRAFRLIEGHNGRIWLESQPEQGTIAHIMLPLARPVAIGSNGEHAVNAVAAAK